MSNDTKPISEDGTDAGFLRLQNLALVSALQASSHERHESNSFSSTFSTANFVGYLCGAIIGESARTLERQLILTREGRGKLREVKKELTLVQSLSWETIEARTETPGVPGEVAIAWKRILTDRLAGVGSLEEVRNSGLDALREQMTAGNRVSENGWTALLAFGKRLRLFQMTSLNYAIARGDSAGGAATFIGVPGNLIPELVAEVNSDGSLMASLSLYDSSYQLSSGSDGKSVSLSIGLEGELWRIGSSVVQSGIATWNLPEAQSILNLSEGLLSLQTLTVSFGELQKSDAETMHSLPCEITDATGVQTQEVPELAHIANTPRIEAELFSAEVKLEADIVRKFPDCRFTLDLAITPNSWQRLGSWEMRHFENRTPTLTAKCPGCPNLTLPSVSLLRGRIVRGEI